VVGNAGGLDVQQLTVHRFVVRAVGQPFPQALQAGRAGIRVQGLEILDLAQVVLQLGVPVLEVQVVAQFVAQAGGHDDGRGRPPGRAQLVVGVQVAGVGQGAVGALEHHLLAAGQACGLLRGVAEAGMVEGEIRHHPRQAGVALVLGLAVGVVVERGIEALGGHGGDGVALAHDLLPEGGRRGGPRKDAVHADDRDLVRDFGAGAGEDLQGVQRAVELRLALEKGRVHVGDGGRAGVQGQGVAHHEVSPRVLLLLVEVDQADLALGLELLEIGAEGLGADEQGADVLLLEGLLALGQGQAFPHPLVLVGDHARGEGGRHGAGGQAHGGAHDDGIVEPADHVLVDFFDGPGFHDLAGKQVGRAHLDADGRPPPGQARGHAADEVGRPGGADAPGKQQGNAGQPVVGEAADDLQGQFPQHQAGKGAHVAPGLAPFEDEAAAAVLHRVLQHGDRGRVEIGLGAGGLQFLDLGGRAAGEKGEGHLMAFHRLQVGGNGLVEGFDADHAGTEAGHLGLARCQDAVGQVGRQAPQGQKGQAAGGIYRRGEIGVVADIGHGPLDDGQPCPMGLGQLGARAQGVMRLHGGQLVVDLFEKPPEHPFQVGAAGGEMACEDGVLPQVEQALEGLRGFLVQGRVVGLDLPVELRLGVLGPGEAELFSLELLDDAGAQLGEEAVGRPEGLPQHGGVLVLQVPQEVLVDFRQGGFRGQVELIVQDDAAGPCGEHAGRRVPAHAPVDEHGQFAVFQVPLHEQERGEARHPPGGLIAAHHQGVGFQVLERGQQVDIPHLQRHAVVGQRRGGGKFGRAAVGQDHEVEVGVKAVDQVVPQGLVAQGQAQAENQVLGGQPVEDRDDLGVGHELGVQHRQGAGLVATGEIAQVEDLGGVIDHQRQAGAEDPLDHASSLLVVLESQNPRTAGQVPAFREDVPGGRVSNKGARRR
jgi:hypothetical protein